MAMGVHRKRTDDTIDNNKITGKRMTTVNNRNPQRHRQEARWKDRLGGIVLPDCDDDLWLCLFVCEPKFAVCERLLYQSGSSIIETDNICFVASRGRE